MERDSTQGKISNSSGRKSLPEGKDWPSSAAVPLGLGQAGLASLFKEKEVRLQPESHRRATGGECL